MPRKSYIAVEDPEGGKWWVVPYKVFEYEPVAGPFSTEKKARLRASKIRRESKIHPFVHHFIDRWNIKRWNDWESNPKRDGCRHCQRVFWSREALDQHILSHKSARIKRRQDVLQGKNAYPCCARCLANFETNAQLQSHWDEQSDCKVWVIHNT